MTQAPFRTSAIETSPSQQIDQQIVYADISWAKFQLIRSGFAESSGIRLAYYDNTIEILMPGREHEMFSRLIGFLIGLFCLEKGIEFEPTGSMTHEKAGEVSVQADESYWFGRSKSVPDLVIEVVFTSGGLSKLLRYRALGILEVWFWQDGVFSLYRLHDGDYVEVKCSGIPELATLDIDVLTHCVLMAQTSRLDAANAFRNALQRESQT